VSTRRLFERGLTSSDASYIASLSQWREMHRSMATSSSFQ
jgi:hypothetical protein